ncbi:hypothetical protein AJ79_03289 [Helicocarpus griseus UAMH5409]|uniref:VOC domain-containing protein n=1 Tax=Helicocarpus griseus UAMH5409 TaxID=1447875 RepID=A0A2B7XYB7_9EURO|nr:hypothetical protein AJ79_03289 [Helicocarpus griseus UAMH5409]
MASQKRSFMISLPTTDITAAIRFGTALGFKPNQAPEDTTVHFECNESFGIFYSTHPVFGKWLPSGREVVSAKTANEVVLTVSVSSKEEVDALVERGIEAGGKRGPNMVPEGGSGCGYIYSRSVEDPDGHLFEIIHHTSCGPEDDSKEDDN